MFSRIVGFSGLAAAIAALGLGYEGHAGAEPPSVGQNVGVEGACVGILDGGELPDLLPASFVWEQLWTAVTEAPEPRGKRLLQDGVAADPLDERTVVALGAVGEEARRRAVALREASIAPGLPGDVATDRDIAAAEAILAGRDELIRLLPSDQYRGVKQTLYDSRREMKYRFPVQGRVRRDAIVGDLCMGMSR